MVAVGAAVELAWLSADASSPAGRGDGVATPASWEGERVRVGWGDEAGSADNSRLAGRATSLSLGASFFLFAVGTSETTSVTMFFFTLPWFCVYIYLTVWS